MISRLKSDPSEVIDLLLKQELVQHDTCRARFLAEHGELNAVPPGDRLITIGEYESDVHFILTGNARIHIGMQTIIDSFGPGNHVGEIAALHVVPRSASVTAIEEMTVLKLGKADFKAFLIAFPDAGFALARDLAKRLEKRNANIIKPGKRHRIFAISSSEALEVVNTGFDFFKREQAFEYAPWTTEIFHPGNYLMEDLEAELMRADFAVAIAQDDDIVESRDTRIATPRDNVIFELGLFIGVLGRKRTILMAPEGIKIKLPTDVSGITIVRYESDTTSNPTSAASAWRQVSKQFQALIK